MEINGSLSECSAANLVRFLEQTQATGCLLLQPEGQRPLSTRGQMHIWLENGFLVGATRSERSDGLFWLIHQNGWTTYNTVSQIAKRYPGDVPMGVYLRAQGVLKTQQIQQLFQMQITESVKLLATGGSAVRFQFESRSELPQAQLTGLRMPLYDAIQSVRRVAVAAM